MFSSAVQDIVILTKFISSKDDDGSEETSSSRMESTNGGM